MTASETPGELRARLDALRAEGDFDLRLPISPEAVAFAFALVNAWPAIDALLARLTAAEADAVRAEMDPSGLGKVWYVEVDGVVIWSYAHIEGPPPDALDLWTALSKALALRERPQ